MGEYQVQGVAWDLENGLRHANQASRLRHILARLFSSQPGWPFQCRPHDPAEPHMESRTTRKIHGNTRNTMTRYSGNLGHGIPCRLGCRS